MFKSIAKISAIIIVIIISTFVVLYWQTNIISNSVKNFLNSELEGVATIEYSELKGNLFEHINISDILVTLQDSSTIAAKSISIEYNLASFIFQPYLVRDLVIKDVSLQLTENKKQVTQQIEKSDPFTINDIPTILDSLINIDSVLAVFPELIVNNCKINAEKIYLSKDMHFKNVDLEFKYAYKSDQLDILVENLKSYWVTYDLNLNKFQIIVSANKERITINQLQIETDHSYLYAKSELSFADQNWIIFDLEDSYFDYYDVSKFASIQDVTTGFLKTSFQIVGSPNNLSTQLFIKGETDEYNIDSLIVDLDFKDNVLTVLNGKILINKTYLTFNGKGSVESSYGHINFKEFNIANLVPDVIQTNLTGHISFDVEKLDLNHITGDGEILLVNSIIDSVRIDSLRFALHANDNNFDIVDPSILKFGEKSKFTVKGELNRNFIINAELFTENNHLNQLFPALNVDTLFGNFDANLTMTGNIKDPNLGGYLFLPYFEKDSIHLDTILLDLKLQKIFSSRKGDAHFSILKGDVYGVALTEALVHINFDSNKVRFDTLRFANNENYISLAGKLEQFQDTVRLGFNLFKAYYQNYYIENSDSILINFFPDEYVINQAFFKAPEDGVLEIRGFWESEREDMQIGLYVENIKLEPFQQFIQSKDRFGGVLNGEVLLIDPLNNPNIESEVTGELISFQNTSLGNVSMDIEYDNGNIYFQEFALDNGKTHFEAEGDITLQFIEEDGKQKLDFIEGTKTNLTVRWQNFDLSRYQHILKMKSPVVGESSGKIEISGTVKDPSVFLSFEADSISYDKYKISELDIVSHYKENFVFLDTLQAEINKTYLFAYGSQRIDMNLEELRFSVENQPMNLNIYSKDDRIEFIGNFLDQIEKITGEYEMNIQIVGTPENPVLQKGFFNIDDGNLELSRVNNPITDLTVEATIEDSKLIIDNLTASSIKEKDILESTWSYIINFFRLFKGETKPEGQLTGSGTIDLKDIQHPKIDLSLDMYEFFVDYFVENTQLLITTENMKISGKDTLNIDADLTIENGKYEVDLDKLRKNIYLASTEINNERAVSWNLEINIPDNFIIVSSTIDLVNNFELEISGNLRAIQEPNAANMELLGHVEILSGSYVAFGQNFEIQQGAIDFSNPQKINPDIEIFAEKETGNYTVELTVNGNLERLMQDLQIRDANGNYLTNLSLYDKLKYISGSGEAGLVNTGEDVINTSVETVLERGAQDLTGLDKVEISDSKGVVNLQSMKLNNGLQDASISIGKHLTNNLYLEYRSQFGAGAIPTPKLSWEPGNQISLAYKINKFWSVESAYAQTLKGNTLINISLAWKTTF